MTFKLSKSVPRLPTNSILLLFNSYVLCPGLLQVFSFSSLRSYLQFTSLKRSILNCPRENYPSYHHHFPIWDVQSLFYLLCSTLITLYFKFFSFVPPFQNFSHHHINEFISNIQPIVLSDPCLAQSKHLLLTDLCHNHITTKITVFCSSPFLFSIVSQRKITFKSLDYHIVIEK